MAEIARPAVLFILLAGDTYTASLETPTEGPSVLAGTVVVSSEDRRDVLTGLERGIGVGPTSVPVESKSLVSLGRLMYSLFLPRSIQDFLRTWEGPLVISTNDPSIPWELLHNGESFIGLDHAVGRRLVAARTPPPRAAVRRERPAFLFVADPRGDLPGAAEEAQQLVSTLSRRGFPCDLLLAERASYLNVQEALGAGRYDVIHYAGHAHAGQDDGGESALELADNRLLPASQIERVLRGAPLVFLNACASGQADLSDTEATSLTDLGATAENLASAFIFGGAQGFIGTLWPVADDGSRAFAATFYDRVLAGDPVGEALRGTRQDIYAEQPADLTWAAFVLYGDPTYRLWQGRPAETVTHPPAVTPDDDAEDGAPPRPPAARRESAPAQGREKQVEGRSRWRSIAGALLLLAIVGFGIVFAWQIAGRGGSASVSVAETATPTPSLAVTASLGPAATPTVTQAVGASATRPATQTPAPPTGTPASTAAYPAPTSTIGSFSFAGRLAFVSKSESEPSELYVMRADGSERTEVGLGVDPDWSPSGDTIAFAGLLDETPGIHLIRPDGSGRARLTTESDWQPTWSPDGERLAFMSLRDVNREIYVVNADGGGLQDLSRSPWEDKHPSWSPAGDKIAFISNRSGAWQVWVMNTDGSRQIRLTDNDFDNFRPVWSPDGAQIAYGVWTGTRNEIWVMNADGSEPHRVTANAVYKQEFAGYGLAWSPQSFISFVSNRLGAPQIFVMQPDGSQQTLVTEVPAGAYSPAWTLQ